MVSLEDLVAAQSGDYEVMLELFDEYSLYAHYLRDILGEDPVVGQVYCSPLRDDDLVPSFGIYRATKLPQREFAWKDQARNLSGDVFELIRILYKLPHKRDALAKLRVDFGLEDNARLSHLTAVRLQHVAPKEKRPVKITIKSRPFKTHETDWWWDRYHVDRAGLVRYQTTAPSLYWMYEDQRAPWNPRGLCFAYRIFDRYQLYFPNANKAGGERKFLNDWVESCLPGFGQLTYRHDTLIVNKAYKDMMCVAGLGLDADVVAYRGENVPIPGVFWEHFRKHYKHIIICVDNDGKSISPLYEGHSMLFMDPLTAKDPSDVCHKMGHLYLTDYMAHNIAQIKEYEARLTKAYAEKVVTLNLLHPFTGKVDRVALEIVGDKQNIVFFFALSGGIKRIPVDLTEAKEVIYVHS